MRKLFLVALISVACVYGASAQQSTANPSTSEIPNMGKAPNGPNGLGRLDARVFDDAGQPVSNVYLKLDSARTDGFFCESWNSTDARGVAVLPPIHMGSLKLTVKAKGYETQKINLDPATLGEPVRVTLKKSS